MTVGRAGAIVVRDGRLALIERHREDRHYWVIPGGSIETGESIEGAAQREAEEELGVAVELGQLRLRIDHVEENGAHQRQWYFDATVATDDIVMRGPEHGYGAQFGTYAAVWVDLDAVACDHVLPTAVARSVVENRGVWPNDIIEIDERA